MPIRPPKHRPRYVDAPAGRCVYDASRDSAAVRGYDRQWQRFRRGILAERPLCQDCAASDRVIAATDVHHVRKLRDRPDLRLDPDNVMALCSSCHDARTARGE